MPTQRDRSVKLARFLLVVAGVGLVTGAVAAILFSLLIANTRHNVAKNNRVLQIAGNLFSDLKDVETGERGYVITTDSNYLAPYYAAEGAMDNELNQLEISNADRIQLTREVTAKRAFARQVIDTLNQEGRDSARSLILSGRDKILMDQLRATLAGIQDQARRNAICWGVFED